MILVIGGLASGKRTYAKEVLGYREGEMADAVLDERPVVYNVQDLVFRDPSASETLFEPLLQKEAVLINEVGAGIIPMDAREREAREKTGRLTIRLAEKATRVIRMVAGLPSVIKE